MESDRSLVMPVALATSVLVGLFLFWLTSQIHYPTISQSDMVKEVIYSSSASGIRSDQAKVVSTVTDFVVTTFLSIQAKSEANHKNDITNGTARGEDLSSQSIQSNTGTCEISSSFPQKIQKWCNLISTNADSYGLDPDLLASLIWQESGGDPNAYSSSGAVGLMQVMPRDGLAATMQCPGGPCFQNRPTSDQLSDPEFNVKYGARMLSNLIARYGSIRDALKAYGPIDVGYYYADLVLGIYHRNDK